MIDREMGERLFLFNPDCELAIADGGLFYTPPANIVKMADDLAFLPAWMGASADRVLVKAKPDHFFLERVCEPLQLNCSAITADELENFGKLRGEPWGRSPKMCHWLAERGMGEEWQPGRKEWYSRKTAREGLCSLFGVVAGTDPAILPEICYTVEEVERRMGDGDYLVKAPWSSSGKGLLPLSGQVGPKEKEWMRGMIRRQGYLMLERRLDKVTDFAMEFYAGEQEVVFLGWSAFRTGGKGEYRGNFIGPQQAIEQELFRRTEPQQLERLKFVLPRMLKGLLPLYRGYLGVDMMVYRNAEGKNGLHPCVEINLRNNMGIIAWSLSKHYLAEEVCGWFEINFYPRPGEALREHQNLCQQFPVVYKNNRIQSGYLNLTPVTETTKFIASIRCY